LAPAGAAAAATGRPFAVLQEKLCALQQMHNDFCSLLH
jgi:hypothetical protein